MAEYLAMQCPLCHKHRLYPPAAVTRDRLFQEFVGHLLDTHPSVRPRKAEEALEEALADTTPKSLDEDSVTVGVWINSLD